MSAPSTNKPAYDTQGYRGLTDLLRPEVLSDPYPLYRRLREEDPVHWDPYLHSWVVTKYADVVTVLRDFSAARTPTPAYLESIGLGELSPVAEVMVKQMLFLDPPDHARVRSLASQAFSPQRMAKLRTHVREVVRQLLANSATGGKMEVMHDLAEPLPYVISAEMLGTPVEDAPRLKNWSRDFAEMLGNFQHNPDRAQQVRKSVEEMCQYFQAAIEESRCRPREGLVHSFATAAVGADRFTEKEIVANVIVTMVGGQETTTNLIGNGMLTLLRKPEEMQRLKKNPVLIPSAIEEMLRFEPPSHYTARLAPEDLTMGGVRIGKRQAVIAVMAAANRDPDRFPEPDAFDIARIDNRHLSFGWAAHYCFGAALARIEAQETFEELLGQYANFSLDTDTLRWRENLGLRGLAALPVKLEQESSRATP